MGDVPVVFPYNFLVTLQVEPAIGEVEALVAERENRRSAVL
jgi:hypothetical protein